MSAISHHVGARIKKCRKSKGLTIEELGKIINKSKATISKYENGSVSIDLDTLQNIADALEVNIVYLLDYKLTDINESKAIDNVHFNKSKIYMYYYDGRTEQIIKTLICKLPSGGAGSSTKVIMYQGIESFENPDLSQHVFVGEMLSYDTITHFFLTNQINKTEKMYVCIFNPLHANSQAIGLLSGLVSNPFFGPASFKVLASNEILEENEDLLNVIKIQSSEQHILEDLNMLFINRPNSLFLKSKD